MIPYRNNRFAVLALILFFLAIAGYAYFEARNILYGPQITIATEAVIETDERLVIISGTAENIAVIRLNNLPIAVTEAGAFEEPYLLAPGYNTIILSAEDKFGRSTTEEVRVLYTPPPDETFGARNQTTTN